MDITSEMSRQTRFKISFKINPQIVSLSCILYGMIRESNINGWQRIPKSKKAGKVKMINIRDLGS